MHVEQTNEYRPQPNQSNTPKRSRGDSKRQTHTSCTRVFRSEMWCPARPRSSLRYMQTHTHTYNFVSLHTLKMQWGTGSSDNIKWRTKSAASAREAQKNDEERKKKSNETNKYEMNMDMLSLGGHHKLSRYDGTTQNTCHQCPLLVARAHTHTLHKRVSSVSRAHRQAMTRTTFFVSISFSFHSGSFQVRWLFSIMFDC